MHWDCRLGWAERDRIHISATGHRPLRSPRSRPSATAYDRARCRSQTTGSRPPRKPPRWSRVRSDTCAPKYHSDRAPAHDRSRMDRRHRHAAQAAPRPPRRRVSRMDYSSMSCLPHFTLRYKVHGAAVGAQVPATRQALSPHPGDTFATSVFRSADDLGRVLYRPMQTHSPFEVLRVFLKLGLTSFGGPVAHIGYFREEFVVRRRWLDDAAFSDLVALCQFLPGPASSQVGFSIGLMRAGSLGGLAAWTGFTLPSAVALTLLALGADAALHGSSAVASIAMGLGHGLKLVAVAIVAQAVWGMARTLCPDLQRAAIAIMAAVAVSADVSSMMQIAVLLCGGLL